MVEEDPGTTHPSDAELAAYLGHELTGEDLRRIQEHLASCSDCRQEVIDAGEILRAPRRARWPVLIPLAAAAAGLVLFFARPLNNPLPSSGSTHREAPGPAEAPVPIAPLGSPDGIQQLIWTRVPGADRYRVTLYDAQGSVLWRETTSDTLRLLPDSVVLLPDRSYFWAVEARVGWDVWESSALVEFQLGGSDSEPAERGR